MIHEDPPLGSPGSGISPDDIQAVLVLVRGEKPRSPDLGRRYFIPKEGLFLGNKPEADVHLGETIKQPCLIHVFQKGKTWHIHDLENFSGTFINGISAQKMQIFDGDLIQLGQMVFEFCSRTGIKFEFFECNEKDKQEDILTKAYNRGYFFSVLTWEIRRYSNWQFNRRANPGRTAPPPMSLIMLDIDHFGAFNKQHGHPVGDAVLKGVVKQVQARVRTTDVVARYGGEEMIIYLPDTPKEKALDVAELIRQKIAEEPFSVKGEQVELRVTVSLGVAEFQPGMDMDLFIKAVDQNMRLAKTKGRNCTVG